MEENWGDSVLDSETIISKDMWQEAEKKRDLNNVLEHTLCKGPINRIQFHHKSVSYYQQSQSCTLIFH